ncbi:CoA transferase [Phaeovulum vinaykumarii]
MAAGNDILFSKLCRALDLGPLAQDPRFATNPARCENHRLLKRLIETVTLTRPRAHWIPRLEAAGVPTGPIQDMTEALVDPQLLARRRVKDIDAVDGRPAFRCAGFPIKMSGLPETERRPPAPLLDGDRAEILAWLDESD